MTALCALILAASTAIEADIGRVVRVGGVHVEDDSGAVLVSWHGDAPHVPASVLKLATAAAVLEALGPDARVTTEFAYDPLTRTLCVTGGGDPFLVSESLRRAADSLVTRGIGEVAVLSADCGLFAQPLAVDGRGTSANPYDAGLSALSVNFNTVAVSVGADGSVVGGEMETPLTPMARRMGERVGRPGTHRLSIVDGVVQAPTYALELIREILRERGVAVGDSTVLQPCRGTPAFVYRHHSQQTSAGTVAAMLEYSNNVIANMLLLTAAAHRLGRPVGIADATALLSDFLTNDLALQGCVVKEGSGLSRENRLTPRQVVHVLHHLRLRGHDELLPLYQGIRAKTGTLNGITCLAGYLPLQDGRVASFAILLEGSPALRDRVLKILRNRLGAAREAVQQSESGRIGHAGQCESARPQVEESHVGGQGRVFERLRAGHPPIPHDHGSGASDEGEWFHAARLAQRSEGLARIVGRVV